MPSGSNASRKTAGRARNQVHSDEIAAGGRSMKRVKRGAESSAESRQEGPVNKKRFVGVRQRPSGRWVAEIKDTTQKIRLWLGTFDSAEEGAKAYDSAARALRGANTRTNFVAAIASSCEATVTTKAARLIRLRQTAAAASSKACANFTELSHGPNQAISRPAFQQGSGNWEAHSQEGTIAPSAITSETLSSAINHSLAESPPDHPRLTCNGASTSATDTELPAEEAHNLHPSPSPPMHPSPSPSPFPCATNRVDEEATSFADENEVMCTGMDVPHANTCQDDAESGALSKEGMEPDVDYHVDDPLDHRNNSILDMIPWPDYVLMDGLDLSWETSTTGLYPAFEFSAEAMDRDSEHYLSDDSSDFLLRLPQNSSSFQGQCELPKSSGSTTDQLPRPPVSPPVDGQSPGSMDSDVGGECPGQADQVLWGSMDLAPLCMVA